MGKLIVAIYYRDTGEFLCNGEVISETENVLTVCRENGDREEDGVIVFRKDTLISLSGLLYIKSSFFC